MVARGMGWASALAAGMGMLSFDVNTLCVSDPPPLPNVDAARVAGYFNPLNPQGAAELNSDFTAIVLHMLWPELCQCVSGTQPPSFPPMQQPPGYVTDNPRLTQPTATPCRSGQQVFETAAFDTAGNYTPGWLPDKTLLPASKWLQLAQNGGSFTAPSPYPVTWTFRQLNAAGTSILGEQTWTQSVAISAAAPITHSFPVIPGAASFTAIAHTDTAPSEGFGTEIHLQQFCSDAPTSIDEPCCPPDPLLEQMIAQVLRLEQQILDALGGSPSYTLGTKHSGLSGAGSFSVSSLRGVLAQVTADPSSAKDRPGNPTYQWDLGWMSVLTGDGMIEERRLTRTNQVWLPTSMPFATTFGFYLNAGVRVDFTELKPA